ncbi:hypothetical protein, conserved [Trypanosoma brucei gambiense DAL972]|uniref:Uncharacterized protein n=1 Tax=Trypanosoma brucei gambiense (strain MHOM/CI/86/DAL972) TaxID=679716 RepID=C9ZXH9_TRYB9|nr:hypothetical protein, conserved [Trypanosoma brucei gambiense DAL972]CBH14123.1 hypothetical protein, conserved [Trypanosoma brucei gambiense DAL972]|eukprot:XP_011776394.1 hypothetical protein, conserved [Trypanosoma brucei gambiense DAL972]
MSESSATEKHVYGYELYSKNVHQYPSITDVKTVKGAIAGNIHDYLNHLGAFEGNARRERGEVLAYSLLAGALSLACVIYFAKDVLLPYKLLTLSLIGVTGAATLCAYVCDCRQKSDNIAFLATCSASTEAKDYLRTLKGHRVCIRLGEVPNSSALTMEAQVVGPPCFFGAPEVHSSSSKVVPYGRYFTKSGYFFPPPLMNDVDNLLSSLKTSTSKKKRQS